jgi:hypothetical protein
MRTTIAKVEIAVFPLLVAVSLFAPQLLMATPSIFRVLYPVYALALTIHVHGLLVLRREKKRGLFWSALAVVGMWMVLSFLPIWFGHTTLFRSGSSDYHQHTFWSFSHVH